jgi:WD40 repeat protein
MRVWEVATGREVHRLHRRGGSAAFAPDSKALAVGWGEFIYLLEVATGKELCRLPTPQNHVVRLAFAPDGRTLASAAEDSTVCLWDVATHKQRLRLRGHTDGVWSVAFAPDSKILASAGMDHSIRLWDVATGKQFRRLDGHRDGVFSLAFSPDGKALASGSDDRTMRLWDLATGKEARTFPKQEDRVSVAFSPDGRVLTGTGDQMIRLWDVATGKALRHWPGHALRIAWLAFAPDGKTLASAAWFGDSAVHFWNVGTGKELRPSEGHSGAVEFIAFSPDGKSLVSRGRDKKVCRWDLATGRASCSFGGPLNGAWDNAALSPDGKVLASGGREDHTVRLWDRAKDKEICRLGKHGDSVYCLAFSPDGKTLASGGRDGMVRLWAAATGTRLQQLVGHTGLVMSVAFSADGQTLVSGGALADGTIRVWDVATGKEVRHLAASHGAYFIAFSPDGRLLASAGPGGNAHLWDVARGKELCSLIGRSGNGAYDLAFSPDAKLLATCSGGENPNAIHLWEVATGLEMRRFEGQPSPTVSFAFCPDGTTLASGEADSTITLWDLTGRMEAGRLRQARLTAEELSRLWPDLGCEAAKAYPAVWALVAAPQQAVPFLRARLRPVAAADPGRIAPLIADLDSNRFAVRDKASKELERLGELAEPALRKAGEGQPSPELGRRVHQLSEKLEGPVTAPERLQALRAITVLEHIGTPEAQEVLQALARGAAEACLTREAKAALDRLTKRVAAGR